MNNSNSSLSGEQTKSCRVWTDDSDRFSVNKIAALRHNFHEHPLFQVAELAQLAKELVPFKKCRFIRPGISQASSFTHDSEHPDGRGVDEMFRHIEEPGSWVALYSSGNPASGWEKGQVAPEPHHLLRSPRYLRSSLQSGQGVTMALNPLGRASSSRQAVCSHSC
ncbi:hypothetical protein [Variovorax sp. CF079]|uniref:hypothetical protein n=1 Tax=Variovorax sp. CF079 TaxID=1882774 RepID=UPI001114436F|nr:hypothetical protein [Variovorax sp. CF079]